MSTSQAKAHDNASTTEQKTMGDWFTNAFNPSSFNPSNFSSVSHIWSELANYQIRATRSWIDQSLTLGRQAATQIQSQFDGTRKLTEDTIGYSLRLVEDGMSAFSQTAQDWDERSRKTRV